MPISLSSELESQLPPIPPCDLGKFSHRILAFKRYLLSIYYVPGTVLSEAVIIPALLNLIVSLEKKASSNLSFKQLWTHSSDYSGEVLSGSEAFSEICLEFIPISSQVFLPVFITDLWATMQEGLQPVVPNLVIEEIIISSQVIVMISEDGSLTHNE